MKRFAIGLAAISLLAIPASASAHKEDEKVAKHSGGTDSRGCHTNHKTGDYHCHNPK